MSRLIDADALIKAWCKKRNINEGDCGAVFVGYSEIPKLINEQPTIKPQTTARKLPTTTWLGSYTPYTCEHCGFHVDSKTRYCPDCGRKAVNYEN